MIITVVAGTNRRNSNSGKIARIIQKKFEAAGDKVKLVDLSDMPSELFAPDNYGNAPASFAPFQDAITNTDGILTIVPEYNGSYPGALKFFIDLLKFPESLQGKPACFVGISAGVFGSLRSVEQLQMVFQYRNAIMFNQYVIVPKVHEKLAEGGESFKDADTDKRIDNLVSSFQSFCCHSIKAEIIYQ